MTTKVVTHRFRARSRDFIEGQGCHSFGPVEGRASAWVEVSIHQRGEIDEAEAESSFCPPRSRASSFEAQREKAVLARLGQRDGIDA